MTPRRAANAGFLRLKSFYRNSVNGANGAVPMERECASGGPPVRRNAGMHPWECMPASMSVHRNRVVSRYLAFLSTSSVTRRGRPLSIGNSAKALRTRYGINPGIVLPSLRCCAVT